MWIGVDRIRHAVAASASLRERLYFADQLLFLQAQQSAACNARHTVKQRLCRWLLRARDVLQSNELPLTQEFLSQMLGVRRTSVTLTARHLQDAGLIKYRHGRVRSSDMDALEAACCGCHEAIKAQQALLRAETQLASSA